MEFVLGSISTVLLASFGYLCYKIGRHKTIKLEKTMTVDEKKKHEAEQKFAQGMNKVVNYDISIAYNKLRGGAK